MKTFWVKAVALLMVAGIIAAYNTVLSDRMQKEEIASLKAQLEAAELGRTQSEQSQDNGNYADGVYEGSAKGFGGNITVSVSIENGKIAEIEIIDAKKEDGAYLDAARGVIDSILQKQSVEVDSISGATYSSNGIKDAVSAALEKAENK